MIICLPTIIVIDGTKTALAPKPVVKSAQGGRERLEKRRAVMPVLPDFPDGKTAFPYISPVTSLCVL